MWTKTFWRQAAERAVKTAAQSVLAIWLVGDVMFNILAVDWGQTLGVSLGALVLSVLTSIVSVGSGQPDSPSLVGTGSYVTKD